MAERPFTKLHTPLLDHVKWLGLSYPAKSAWYSLLHLSGRSHGSFTSEAQVIGLLRREGHPDPAAAIAELIEAHLLDEGDERELVLHDWSDWQPEWRGPSDAPEALAARQRASRASRGVTNGHDVSRGVTSGSHDVTPGHAPKRQEKEGERDNGGAPRGRARGVNPLPSPLSEAEQVTGPIVLSWLHDNGYSLPSGYAMPVLTELVAKVPAPKIIEALAAGKAAGVLTTRQLVTYVEQALTPRPNGRPARPRATHATSQEELTNATRTV